MRERAEDRRGQDDQNHRSRNLSRGGGFGVDPLRGLAVEPRRVRQDRRLHQRGGLGQIRRTDRITGPVVGPRDLDQPGVDRQLGIDPPEQLDQRLVGQPTRRPGHGHRRVGDGLLVTLPDGPRLGLGDEGGGGSRVGHRQSGVEPPGRERQRLGVAEHGRQRMLSLVDGGRGGERTEPAEDGQHKSDRQDAARRRRYEPPAGVGRFDRRPRTQRLSRRVRQLDGHVWDLIFQPCMSQTVLSEV